MKKLLSLAFSLLIVTLPVTAKVQHVENVHLLERYFELAGVNQLLESVPAQVESMYIETVEEQGENAADSQILAALLAAWDQQNIKSNLMIMLAKQVDQQKLADLISWQDGKLAKLIKAHDLRTEEQEFPYSFQRFAQQLPQSLPSKEKMALINDIIDAKQMIDSMVELTISVSEPVMAALMASPEALQEGFDRSSINQQLDELKTLLENDLSSQMSLLSYFLYQDIAEQDLIAYAAFYQSDLGQLELTLFSNVLQQSIELWQEEYYQRVLVISPLARVTD